MKYKDKKDEIIDQSVKKGETLKKGQSITLYVPKVDAVYPDMVENGWDVSRATEFCEKYGLTIKVTNKETDEAEEGTILAQKPKAGEEIFENETVTVVVAKKPTQTTTTTTKTTTTTEAKTQTNEDE